VSPEMKKHVFLWPTVLAIILMAACAEQEDRSAELIQPQPARIPTQEMWASRIIITEAGHKQAILDYGHMIQYRGDERSYFDEGVQVDFFDREGRHASRLTANTGTYHQKDESVQGLGNVIVVSDSGYVMKTERLEYIAATEKIRSDTLVMMISPQLDTLWSVGFESNADLTHRVFYRPRIHFNRALETATSHSKEVASDSVQIERNQK